jgi:hypothetical protein
MNSQIEPNWTILIIDLIFTIYFAWQAYINIHKKRMTKLGVDGIMYFFIKAFSDKKTLRGTEKLIDNPENIRKMGKYALYTSLGGIIVAIRWYLEQFSR